MNPLNPRERGAMLIDVLIGVTIVVAVVAVAYPGFKVANDTITTSTQRDMIERSADRTLNRLVDAVRSGRIVTITGPGTAPQITLQTLEAGLDITQLSSGNPPPLWQATNRTIRFVQQATISESTAGIDINRDGDQTDEFALGSIELVNGDRVERLSGNARIMLGLPSYVGDVNGDGVADPLVEQVGRELRIKLTIVNQADQGRFQATTLTSQLHLRNPQD